MAIEFIIKKINTAVQQAIRPDSAFVDMAVACEKLNSIDDFRMSQTLTS